MRLGKRRLLFLVPGASSLHVVNSVFGSRTRPKELGTIEGSAFDAWYWYLKKTDAVIPEGGPVVLESISSDSDCQKDIDALGLASQSVSGAQSINDDSLAQAISGMDVKDGTTATEPASSLNDPEINKVPNVANGPISNLFKIGVGSTITQAAAQGGGSTVYFRPAYVLRISLFHGAGLVTHEALHNLGLDDPGVEVALGLTSAECGAGTDCISVKLEQDCFQPRGVQLLGLP